MNIQNMNQALQGLLEKYGVPAVGELTRADTDTCGAAARLKTAGGEVVELLPWRIERRFVELKKIIEGKTLEGVSTLRFASMSNARTLAQLLYREFDLCEFLGGASVKSAFAAVNGSAAANVVVKLADGKSCSIECSAVLPEGADEIDRHEIIARRGVACDRVVDTQVPQSSIYAFTKNEERRYTDTDAELFGFGNDEIILIRAAFELLAHPELMPVWNKASRRLAAIATAALDSDKNGTPVIFEEGAA